jgi:selenocysteine lyase/cysteine desulfurase
MESRDAVRSDFARLINAEPDEVALGLSTTRGITDIALSFPWRPGDRVVLFTGEFPANITPWQRAAVAFGLELVFHPLDPFLSEAGLAALEKELERGVRLVAVSAVQFQTGLRMPLREIGELCSRYGSALAVDAIQACGAVPLDVVECQIDFLTTGMHKWLLGVEGAGFLYVSKRYAGKLRPLTAGWLSHEHAVDFLLHGPGHLNYDRPLRASADVFEAGTTNLLGFAAASASLPLLLRLGVPAIYAHTNQYLDELETGLLARGFVSLRAKEASLRSTFLCVQHTSKSSVELCVSLRARGVITATPDGNLRFAPHFSNALSEIPEVLAAVDRALL